MNESNILEAALAVLQKNYPFDVAFMEKSLGVEGPDGVLSVRHGTAEHHLDFEVKTRIDKTRVALIVVKTNDENRRVLITPYVSPDMAVFLKAHGIEFIDACGNVFIDRPPLYLFVKGQKPEKQIKQAPVIRAFKAGGLKVLFTLLSLPGSEKKPFRELASLSGVSLGTVDWVIKDLIKLGFLMDAGEQGRKLIRKKELLERWVTAYPEQLQTKLDRKKFTSSKPQWWKETSFEHDHAFWSGDVAALKLTGYLIPETVVLYARKPYTALIVNNKLRNDPSGSIEIRDVFWNFTVDYTAESSAPPILVYADLMATGDSRSIETAGIIYDDYITELVR